MSCQRPEPAEKIMFTATRAVVGLTGLEPVTLRLSSACSNQLSYRPTRHRRMTGADCGIQSEMVVELRRLELLTYSLQSYRSTN
jgi:hypothetical protein